MKSEHALLALAFGCELTTAIPINMAKERTMGQAESEKALTQKAGRDALNTHVHETSQGSSSKDSEVSDSSEDSEISDISKATGKLRLADASESRDQSTSCYLM
jgi:hypothetical protein